MAEVDRYATDGYVHMPALVANVDALTEEFHRVWNDRVPGNSAWSGGYLAAYEAEKPPAGWELITLPNLHGNSTLWRDTVEDLTPIADTLIGAPSKVHAVMGLVKPPETGQPFPLHQDASYYGPKDGRYTILTIYLDDMTAENGALRIVPRSHARGWLPHVGGHGEGKFHLSSDTYTMADTIQIDAKAGDGLWMHLWMVHGSEPNRSAQMRRTVRVGYVAV